MTGVGKNEPQVNLRRLTSRGTVPDALTRRSNVWPVLASHTPSQPATPHLATCSGVPCVFLAPIRVRSGAIRSAFLHMHSACQHAERPLRWPDYFHNSLPVNTLCTRSESAAPASPGPGSVRFLDAQWDPGRWQTLLSPRSSCKLTHYVRKCVMFWIWSGVQELI